MADSIIIAIGRNRKDNQPLPDPDWIAYRTIVHRAVKAILPNNTRLFEGTGKGIWEDQREDAYYIHVEHDGNYTTRFDLDNALSIIAACFDQECVAITQTFNPRLVPAYKMEEPSEEA